MSFENYFEPNEFVLIMVRDLPLQHIQCEEYETTQPGANGGLYTKCLCLGSEAEQFVLAQFGWGRYKEAPVRMCAGRKSILHAPPTVVKIRGFILMYE